MIHQDTLSTEDLSDHNYPPSLPVPKSLVANGVVVPGPVSDRPPLLVKLTGYRLVSTTIIIALSATKMVPSLNGSMLASAWPNWGLATLFGGLLLLNLSEGVRPKGAGWFFHEDLTPDLLLWPIGFLFIVCGISGALALFFAIGLNLAGLACLLPISPSTYDLLILPIVIVTDALTAAILGAIYYMLRHLRPVFGPLLRTYKNRRDLHPMAYSLSFQIGVGLLGCLSLLMMVETFCIDNRGSELCAWPCSLMIPALSKRAQVSCGFPKPAMFISSRATATTNPIHLTNTAIVEPSVNNSYIFFIASRVVVIIALVIYLYNYE